jgi:hypothetical protein
MFLGKRLQTETRRITMLFKDKVLAEQVQLINLIGMLVTLILE